MNIQSLAKHAGQFEINPMNRFLYKLKTIFLGLAMSQVIATLQVYLSNIKLYRSITAIHQAGYLAIPNQHVALRLQTLGPAVGGGLFFTFTTGACLAIFALVSAWIWDCFLSRKKIFLPFFSAFWLGGLAAANYRGLCPMVSAYFFFIPPAVFTAASKWRPDLKTPNLRPRIGVHIAAFTLLVFIGATQMNVDTFLSIRDNLFLSNPLGRIASNVYYSYSPFAAQVFKAPAQKSLKTGRLLLGDDPALFKRIENELRMHDFLILDQELPVDLIISTANNTIALINNNRTIIRTTPSIFLRDPGTILKQFSQKSDRFVFFRRFTFFALLFLSSAILYLSIYTPAYLALRALLSSTSSSVLTAVLCCTIGSALLLSFQLEKTPPLNATDMAKAFESDSWRQRVANLKIIEKNKIEIGNFPARRKMLLSPNIPERYWLARAMSVSRDPRTYPELLQLLSDPQLNVICAALYALGRRGEAKAVDRILTLIKTTDSWYIQQYAYEALRNLGWKQTKFKPSHF